MQINVWVIHEFLSETLRSKHIHMMQISFIASNWTPWLETLEIKKSPRRSWYVWRVLAKRASANPLLLTSSRYIRTEATRINHSIVAITKKKLECLLKASFAIPAASTGSTELTSKKSSPSLAIVVLILLAVIIVNGYALNSTEQELNSTQTSFNQSAKEQPVSRNAEERSGLGIYIGGGGGFLIFLCVAEESSYGWACFSLIVNQRFFFLWICETFLLIKNKNSLEVQNLFAGMNLTG